MDLKQPERCLRGYVFVPYCTESCCQNQLQGFQVPPSYPSASIPKCNAFRPELSASTDEEDSRFTSNTSDGYRVLFPAISGGRPQQCEVSRHEFGIERLLTTFQPNQGTACGPILYFLYTFSYPGENDD